jgi:uncharacterized protein (TIGR03000 family)
MFSSRSFVAAAALAVGGALALAGTALAQHHGHGGGHAAVRPAPVVHGGGAPAPAGHAAFRPGHVVVPASVGGGAGFAFRAVVPRSTRLRGSGVRSSASSTTFVENNFYAGPTYYLPGTAFDLSEDWGPGYLGPADAEAEDDGPAYMPPADAEAPEKAPPSAPADASVKVILPDAEADIWFNGKRTATAGAVRSFSTPPLEPGRNYYYDVTAAWYQDGRLVTAQRTATVSPGRTTVIDFTRPAPRGKAPTGTKPAAAR